MPGSESECFATLSQPWDCCPGQRLSGFRLLSLQWQSSAWGNITLCRPRPLLCPLCPPCPLSPFLLFLSPLFCLSPVIHLIFLSTYCAPRSKAREPGFLLLRPNTIAPCPGAQTPHGRGFFCPPALWRDRAFHLRCHSLLFFSGAVVRADPLTGAAPSLRGTSHSRLTHGRCQCTCSRTVIVACTWGEKSMRFEFLFPSRVFGKLL